MSESVGHGPSLIKLGKLANSKKYDELENLWIKAMDNSDYSFRELVPIAGQVGRLGATERAETLLEMLISNGEEKHGINRALDILRQAVQHLPDGSNLREEISRLYLEQNSGFAEFDQLLNRLCRDDIPLDQSVSMIDTYLQLQPGDYLVDHGFLVPGIVEKVNCANGVITARFEDRHAEYGPDTLNKVVPKASDYFPALVLYNPDHLRDLANEDALGFVELALKASREGRVQYRDLKNQVTRLLGEKGWRNWWKGARLVLKRAPLIGMSGGSQPTFRTLKTPDRYEDRLRREFEKTAQPEKRLLKVLAYIDEIEKAAKNKKESYEMDQDLMVHFGNSAAKIAVASLQKQPALALAGLSVHAAVAKFDIAVATPNPKAAAHVLGTIEDTSQLPNLLPDSLLHHALKYIRTTMPDQWPTVWQAVLMHAGKRMIDVITKALIETEHLDVLEQALIRASERPTSSPDLIVWLWRARQTANTGAILKKFESLSELVIVESLLSLIEITGRLQSVSGEERHMRILETARGALFMQSSEPIRNFMNELDKDTARTVKGKIQRNEGLNAAQRAQLLGVLRTTYPELFVEITTPWEEDVFYTTEKGLQARQMELNKIIEDDIPEVAEQIGEAASHGDLSENAEYTAALEKRDQLTSRGARIEAELKRAVVISWEMAHSNYVNIGTKVTIHDDETEEETVYSFLGLWDADVEHGILNYQAPLSLAFMGLRVGEIATYGEEGQQKQWRIVSIEPAV